MQTKNSNFLGTLLKQRKLNSLEKSEFLNLPELQFFNWCHQQYGLNKGVYHTVDNWFYEYGIVHIQYRRINLVAFLEFAKGEGIKQNKLKFIRFGNGGLNRKLYEFIKVYRVAADGSDNTG